MKARSTPFNLAINLIQTVFSLFISFFTTRILVEKFGLTNFGVFWLLFGLSQTVLFFQPGLNIGAVRFLSIAIGQEYNNSDKTNSDYLSNPLSVRQVFNSIFLSYSLILLFLLLLGPLVGYLLINEFLKIGDVSFQIAFFIFISSIISVSASLISAPYRSVLISYKRFDIINFVAILLPTVDFIGAYFLPSLQPQSLDLLIYSILKTLASVATSSILILFCIFNFDCIRLSQKLLFNFGALFRVFSFVGWKMLGQSLYILRNKIVALLVNSFFGPLGTSGYEISSKLAFSQNKLIGTIQSTFTPTLGNLYGQKKLIEYFENVLLVNKLGMLAAFVLIMPILFYSKTIFIFWLGKYDDFITPFIIGLLIAFLIDRSSVGTMISIAMHGKIMYYEIAGGFSLFSAVPLSWILYQKYNSPYAFTVALIISTFLLTIVRIVTYNIMYHKSFVKEFAKWSFPMSIYIVLEIILYFSLQPIFPQTILNFFSYFIIHLFILTLTTFLLLLKANERSLIFKRLRLALT